MSHNPDRELVITRDLDFPRSRVFEAWTRPEFLMQWYAPRGCTIRFEHIDVRTGGSFHSCLHNPTFGECWVVGRYLEVKAPERIVFTMTLSNQAGELVTAAEAGHDADWQPTSTVTITLTELGPQRTRMVLHQDVSEHLAKRTGAYPSWLEMLDHLENLLSTPINPR